MSSVLGAIMGQRDNEAALAAQYFQEACAAEPTSRAESQDRAEYWARRAARHGRADDLFHLACVKLARAGRIAASGGSDEVIGRLGLCIQILDSDAAPVPAEAGQVVQQDADERPAACAGPPYPVTEWMLEGLEKDPSLEVRFDVFDTAERMARNASRDGGQRALTDLARVLACRAGFAARMGLAGSAANMKAEMLEALSAIADTEEGEEVAAIESLLADMTSQEAAAVQAARKRLAR